MKPPVDSKESNTSKVTKTKPFALDKRFSASRNPTLIYRFLRLLLIPVIKLCFRWQLTGKENLPKTGGYILICNHMSWVDPFIILAALPAKPVMHVVGDLHGKVKNKFVLWFLDHSGLVLLFSRQDGLGSENMGHVAKVLSVGVPLLLFPEGTRGIKTNEEELLPFKKGFAHFASQAQVPVIPMALTGTLDVWLRKKILLRIGQPLKSGLPIEVMVKQAEQKVKEVKEVYLPSSGRKPLHKFLNKLFLSRGGTREEEVI